MKVYQFTFWMPREVACDRWHAHFLGKGIPVGIVRKHNSRGEALYAVWIRLKQSAFCAPDKRRENYDLVRAGNGFEALWEAQEVFKSDTAYHHPRVRIAAEKRTLAATSVPVAGSV